MKIFNTITNIFFVILSFSFSAIAAENNQIHCFQFSVLDSPDVISQPSDFANEVWCYKKAEDGTGLLVFNYDQQKIRPELSFLVGTDGTTSAGILMSGKINYVKTPDMGVSPVNIPLDIKQAEIRSLQKVASASPDSQKVNQLLENLKSAPLIKNDFKSKTRSEESAYLDSSKYPYSGYWWSHRDQQLFAGSNSPLGKYDSAYLARTGQNPGAVDWEAKHHSLANVPWGGHCNGWAASSILYPEWNERLYDPLTKKIIQPTDVQGLLAEGSFCVYWAFYGKRYNGQAGDDLSDIHADLFHKVLRYYLKAQKKPIAMDYVQDESVDNNVITGYKSDITPVEARPNWYHVTTILQMHDYDHVRNESAGSATMYESTYEYLLEMDANGNPTNGEWISENPDFLWVPLSQKDCGRENPNIHLDFVFDWLNSLPKAAKTTMPLDLQMTHLAAGEHRTVIETNSPLIGSEFTLNFNQNLQEFSNLYSHVKGKSALYPTATSLNAIDGWDPVYYDNDTDSTITSFEQNHFRIKLSDLGKFEFVNYDDQPIEFPSDFKIESLEFWAPPN